MSKDHLIGKDGMIHGHKAIPAGKRMQPEEDVLLKLTEKQLLLEYLCEKKHSACYRTGTCDEMCRYGKRYLELRAERTAKR